MKIVHVTHLYHPSEGGVQFLFKNFSERLVKDYGDDVTVVTCNSMYGPERKLFKKIEPARETINGVKVIRFPYQRWHIWVYPYIFKLMVKLGFSIPEKMLIKASGPYSPSMIKYLMTTDADAICGSSASYYYMQLPLWRKCNFFYLGAIHLNLNESKQAIYKTQLDSINASNRYIASTLYEKERLEALGVKKNKIVVIGTGVNPEDFVIDSNKVKDYRQSLGIPEHGVLIGYVGRIEKTKNVLHLLNSFLQSAKLHPNLYLLIAGAANTYLEELKEFAKQLPDSISSRIKWKGNFALEEKAHIFHSIDVLVLPSYNESFGIVFLEAWICKKPVIGVAIGAVKNVINNGVDGLLIDPHDNESLCNHLQNLSTNKALRDQLGERGYNKVIENYTWEKVTAKLRQSYLYALNNTQQPTQSN